MALIWLLAGLAYPQAITTPPRGDLEVFYRYLMRAHGEVSGVASATSKPEAAAARLHTTAGDLYRIEGAYRTAAAAIAALDSEARGYIDRTVKAGQRPERAKLETYYQRRLQILRAASSQLRQALGDEKWFQVQDYIDGEFRSGIKRRALPWSNPN